MDAGLRCGSNPLAQCSARRGKLPRHSLDGRGKIQGRVASTLLQPRRDASLPSLSRGNGWALRVAWLAGCLWPLPSLRALRVLLHRDGRRCRHLRGVVHGHLTIYAHFQTIIILRTQWFKRKQSRVVLCAGRKRLTRCHCSMHRRMFRRRWRSLRVNRPPPCGRQATAAAMGSRLLPAPSQAAASQKAAATVRQRQDEGPPPAGKFVSLAFTPPP